MLIFLLSVFSGVFISASVGHFSVGMRQPRDLQRVVFGAMCILAAFLEIALARMYATTHVDRYIFWQRLSEVASMAFFGLVPWLLYGATDRSVRWPSIVLSAGYFALLALRLMPIGIFLRGEVTLHREVTPWGETVTSGAGQSSPLLLAMLALQGCLFAYFAWVVRELWRSRRREDSIRFAVAVAPLILSIALIGVFALLRMKTFAIGTLGFVLTVILMNLNLRRDARLRQERIQAVLDNVPMALWVKDANLRYLFVNKFYERTFGYGMQQLAGRSDLEIFPANLAAGWRASDNVVLETNAHVDVEQQLQLGRRLRTMSAVLFPLRDTAGRAVGLGGASTDITERKRTADAIQALAHSAGAEDSDELFRTCAQQLAITYGADRAFVLLCPDGATTLHSLADWPAEGTSIFDQTAVAGTACGAVMRDGRLFVEAQVCERFPDDQQLAAIGAESFFAAPLISTSTRILGVIGVVSKRGLDMFPTAADLLDIFAKRVAVELDRIAAVSALRTLASQLEVRVSERTRELEQLNRELEAFAYSVSHDLRAPLRAIDGYSSLLLTNLEPTLDERSRGHLGRVRDAVRRMAELIDDLLELAKVTQADLRATNVDITAIALQSLARLREQEPGRTVDINVAPGMVMFGDQRLLNVAVDNLLQNAWKYTGQTEHGVIEVGLRNDVLASVLYVRDNGVGFDPAYADKLFKVFQRLHNSASFAGTGVGLAIVARIIERHRGKVWASSEPGKGATFYFSLPHNVVSF